MRIFLFVLNGLGVGSLPDYSKYDKEYYCTSLNIKCIDDLTTLNKLGLKKCCLDLEAKNSLGYCFRGRSLSINTTFESGLNEILGNVTFNNSPKVENLVDVLKRHNVGVTFISSRENSIAEHIYCDDKAVFENVNSSTNKDSVVIAELNDFAKAGLVGDTEGMETAIKFADKKIAEIISHLTYNDILILTGNFGVNPLKIGITREYNPIFILSKITRGNSVLKTIQGNDSIAMTIVNLLNIYPNSKSIVDDSFVEKMQNNGLYYKGDRIIGSIGKVKELKVPIARERKTKDKSKTNDKK